MSFSTRNLIIYPTPSLLIKLTGGVFFHKKPDSLSHLLSSNRLGLELCKSHAWRPLEGVAPCCQIRRKPADTPLWPPKTWQSKSHSEQATPNKKQKYPKEETSKDRSRNRRLGLDICKSHAWRPLEGVAPCCQIRRKPADTPLWPPKTEDTTKKPPHTHCPPVTLELNLKLIL